MPQFKVRVDGLATGATANTFLTLLGLKMPDSAGCRGRLRRITVSGAGSGPQDIQVSLRLRRTDNTADGTSSAINVNTIGSDDPSQAASVVTAIGSNYTVEPTTFETGTLGLGAFNSRGTLIAQWGEREAPIWGPNQTLCLEGAPGSSVACGLEVLVEWDEF